MHLTHAAYIVFSISFVKCVITAFAVGKQNNDCRSCITIDSSVKRPMSLLLHQWKNFQSAVRYLARS